MKDKDTDKAGKERAGSISILRFVLTYVLLMGAFFLLLGLKPVQNVVDINGGYSNAIVYVTSKVLHLFGISSTVQGSVIHLPSISLDVEFGCNGLEAVMIYAVAVLTFPASWTNRLIGIIAGFMVIQVLNLIRIVALAYAGVYHKDLFDLIHLYVAQGVMIAVALATFVLYLTYLNHGQGKQEALI
ncbi:MAG TPA: exosortase H [Thermodesulfobacteriota bacterium]|nr:exosortase H [Thermodesulfobacteriota bacterium]